MGAHRAALMARRQKWPMPLWIVLQSWLALRWRLFFARPETDLMVARFALFIERTEGVSPALQRARILELSRRYCIHPIDAYRFRLYRDPDRVLDYVYDVETAGMHLLMNGPKRLPDHDRLMDKVAFAERALRIGLPVVPTLALLERGDDEDLRVLADICAASKGGVFVKARASSRAEGAFLVQQVGEEDKIEGRSFDGTPIRGTDELRAALRAICRTDSALVQPFLTTHSSLTNAKTSRDAVVLRVISRRGSGKGGKSDLPFALLRFPMTVQSRLGKPSRFEVVARVQTENGAITRGICSSLELLPHTRELEDSVFCQLSAEATVPFWQEIQRHSLAAQEAYRQLSTIAWDWVVTDEGPKLLEGNVIWGMRLPQEMEGGLLDFVREGLGAR